MTPLAASVDGRVGTLVLDAPPMNLLTAEMRDAIVGALDEFRAGGVRAVVVAGAGDNFCAGADLNEERALTAETAPRFREVVERVFRAVAEYPGGVVAALNGHAYGGGFELALACDVRVAARSARLAGVGVRLGLCVSTARLTRVAGEAVAMDLLLTGRAVDADEAQALGLVSTVVDDTVLREEAARWAATIASRAPLSVRANKAALRGFATLPFAEASALERREWARLQRTRDHAEALAAFFAKREPRFVGA